MPSGTGWIRPRRWDATDGSRSRSAPRRATVRSRSRFGSGTASSAPRASLPGWPTGRPGTPRRSLRRRETPGGSTAATGQPPLRHPGSIPNAVRVIDRPLPGAPRRHPGPPRRLSGTSQRPRLPLGSRRPDCHQRRFRPRRSGLPLHLPHPVAQVDGPGTPRRQPPPGPGSTRLVRLRRSASRRSTAPSATDRLRWPRPDPRPNPRRSPWSPPPGGRWPANSWPGRSRPPTAQLSRPRRVSPAPGCLRIRPGGARWMLRSVRSMPARRPRCQRPRLNQSNP